jgi:hypothetical protein
MVGRLTGQFSNMATTNTWFIRVGLVPTSVSISREIGKLLGL